MEKGGNQITIHITPGSFFKAVLILILFWFLFYIKDLILVVLTAVVIASGLEPLIRWFKKYKIQRLPAAIVSYIGLAVFFGGTLFFFVPAVLDEASTFLSTIPNYLNTTALWNPLSSATENLAVSRQVVSDLSATARLGDIVTSVQNITANISDGLLGIVSFVFGGLLSFVLIVVLSFYLLVQEDGVAKFLELVTPVRHEKYIIDLWKRSQAKIGQWMQGQFLLGVLVGVLVYLGLTVLGVKNALLLAIIAGIFEIIPVFGPIISAIPAVLSGFSDGGPTTALLVTGLYLIVQQFENHLIYPLVVRKVVGVSPILVILALIIGAQLAGFLGVVLSVPIAAVLMEFVEDLEKKKHPYWEKEKQTS